jgi:hypothetical protein|tara:strand:- start:1614 stop:1751 length:138 start_codon:yes stop_codon:yes gene_type:complete
VSAEHQTPEQAADADRKADVKAILVIFTTMVLMALHFVSGWKFDF